MKSMLQIALLSAFVLLFTGAAPALADYNTPQAEGAGKIQSLDFANQVMVVSGAEFGVSPTVQVEIAGSYGAFTMLETGMLIEFTYLHFDDGAKVMQTITEVDQVEEY